MSKLTIYAIATVVSIAASLITNNITHNSIIALIVLVVVFALIASMWKKKIEEPIQQKIDQHVNDSRNDAELKRAKARIEDSKVAKFIYYVAWDDPDDSTKDKMAVHIFYGPVTIDPDTDEVFNFVDYICDNNLTKFDVFIPENSIDKRRLTPDIMKQHMRIDKDYGVFFEKSAREQDPWAHLTPFFSSILCPEYNMFHGTYITNSKGQYEYVQTDKDGKITNHFIFDNYIPYDIFADSVKEGKFRRYPYREFAIDQVIVHSEPHGLERLELGDAHFWHVSTDMQAVYL